MAIETVLWVLAFAGACALDFAVSNLVPARFGRWLAYFPVPGTRRFRYRVAENDNERASFEISERHLDDSLETELRVVRDVRVGARVDYDKPRRLVGMRARWVKEELELSFRCWPPFVLPMLVCATAITVRVTTRAADASLRPTFAIPMLVIVVFAIVLVTALLSLDGARYDAERLALELIELVRPSPLAEPREIATNGELLALERPRASGTPIPGTVLTQRASAAVGAALAVACVFFAGLAGACALHIAEVSSLGEAIGMVLALLVIVALTVISYLGMALGFHQAATGRSHGPSAGVLGAGFATLVAALPVYAVLEAKHALVPALVVAILVAPVVYAFAKFRKRRFR